MDFTQDGTHYVTFINSHIGYFQISQNWVPNGNDWYYNLLSITKPPQVWINLSSHVEGHVNFSAGLVWIPNVAKDYGTKRRTAQCGDGYAQFSRLIGIASAQIHGVSTESYRAGLLAVV